MIPIGVNLIKEIIKAVALYIMPIASFFISFIALWKTRKVEKLESKIREYDAFIKEAEVERIREERSRKPSPQIDARITKISKGSYRLYIFNKGDGDAYNVDYKIKENVGIRTLGNITPFEKLEPGNHFEEPVIVAWGGSSKFRICLSWEDESGEKHQNELVKSFE